MRMSEQRKDYDVAIVGGGFCGAMVAVQLARMSAIAPRVALFDRTGSFGKGVAYGTTVPLHLLNVPAGRMSAFADTPDHFLEWLRRNPAVCERFGVAAFDASSFLPRATYGAYLTSLLQATLHERPGFKVINAEVIDIAKADDDLLIVTTAGLTFCTRSANPGSAWAAGRWRKARACV